MKLCASNYLKKIVCFPFENINYELFLHVRLSVGFQKNDKSSRLVLNQ